jgi:uncharacterized membrane protein YGL010W
MEAAEVRPIHRLIGQYAESHRHPTNVLIHWICVPIIVWCALAFAYAVHPYAAMAAALFGLAYYLTLSPAMAAAMLVFSALCIASYAYVPYLPWVALVLFVVTWIFQFIGHEIEGKKPSFLDDLRFLLIGPVFLLAKAFRKAGIGF